MLCKYMDMQLDYRPLTKDIPKGSAGMLSSHVAALVTYHLWSQIKISHKINLS